MHIDSTAFTATLSNYIYIDKNSYRVTYLITLNDVSLDTNNSSELINFVDSLYEKDFSDTDIINDLLETAKSFDSAINTIEKLESLYNYLIENKADALLKI